MRTDRSMLDFVAERSRSELEARARRARSRRGSTSTSSTCARSSGASSGPSSRRTTHAGRAERAGRRARVVRGARRADVRPAGAGVPGRPDARLHVHDGARGQPADLSGDRRHRAASRDLAPRQPPGGDRGARQAEHLPRAAVREVPRAAAIDARRRRLAARSLADRLRQRHERRQRAHRLAAAARRRRRRRRARCKGNRHIVTPEGTPMANLLLALSQKCGVEQDRFGVSKGAVEICRSSRRCSFTRPRSRVVAS